MLGGTLLGSGTGGSDDGLCFHFLGSAGTLHEVHQLASIEAHHPEDNRQNQQLKHEGCKFENMRVHDLLLEELLVPELALRIATATPGEHMGLDLPEAVAAPEPEHLWRGWRFFSFSVPFTSLPRQRFIGARG